MIMLVFSFSFPSGAQTVSDKLHQYFEAAQKAGTFNGSVLVAQKENILINKGYGHKEIETKKLNDSNTVYQIGSITKQFTSTVILKLAEQGKLALSDKLSKYFPDFSYSSKITLEQLLTHTSGIFNFTNDTAFMANGWYNVVDKEKVFAVFKNRPLDFEPGTKYNYSNSGYYLLGAIIEKVTGKKYELVVRDMIFKPLNMTHSGFDFIALKSPDKATGYYLISEELNSKARLVDSTVSFAAGAIYSTTEDLYKWNQSLLSAKILNARTLENAFTPRLSKYGLGYIIDTVLKKQIVSHNGGVDGFISHSTVIPTEGTQVIIFCNNMSTPLNNVIRAVFAILYNQPYEMPELKQSVNIDTVVLRQYVGEYELTPAIKITVTLVDGRLKAQVTGQAAYDIFASKENLFFYKIVDAQLEFLKNEKGDIEKLILHQNGQHMPAKKVK